MPDLQVIGAGFGRTGTLSLKRALETLGFGPCYHQYRAYEGDDMERWRAGDLSVLDGYASTVDWPGCTFWRELTVACPSAKVVLTLRDPASWYRSFATTIAPILENAHRRSDRQWVEGLHAYTRDVIEDRSFPHPVHDLGRSSIIAAYNAHNGAVVAALHRTGRLLVRGIGDGWESLCEFLAVPIPASSFPYVNDELEFHRLHSARPSSREELAELFHSAAQ